MALVFAKDSVDEIVEEAFGKAAEIVDHEAYILFSLEHGVYQRLAMAGDWGAELFNVNGRKINVDDLSPRAKDLLDLADHVTKRLGSRNRDIHASAVAFWVKTRPALGFRTQRVAVIVSGFVNHLVDGIAMRGLRIRPILGPGPFPKVVDPDDLENGDGSPYKFVSATPSTETALGPL